MNRRITYKIKNVSKDNENFSNGISKIDGIVGFNFDGENLTYEINEWASDYDVMLKVMQTAENVGGELIFDDEEGETNQLAEELPEELKNPLGDDEEEVIDETTGETVKRKTTPKKTLSDFALKGYEILFSLLTLIIYLFIPNTKLGSILLLVGFTVVGYEIIYSAITKVVKKDLFNSPLYVILSAIILLFVTGDSLCCLIIALTYTLGDWLKEFTEKRSLDALNNLSDDEKTEFSKYRENLKSSQGGKLYKTVKYYNIVLLGLAVIITFIPPIFNAKNYGYYLGVWARKGAFILLAVDLLETVIEVEKITTDALRNLYLSSVKLNSEKSLFAIGKVKQVIFDYESLIGGNNELNADVTGAMQELKDLGVKREILLSSQSKDQTREIRKQLKMYNSFGEISKDKRLDKIAEIISKDKMPTMVFGEKKYGETLCASFIDVNADAYITEKEISLFPYLYKVARRRNKLSYFTVAVSLICKALVICLAVFTELDLWIIALIFGLSWILYGGVSLLSQKRVD